MSSRLLSPFLSSVVGLVLPFAHGNPPGGVGGCGIGPQPAGPSAPTSAPPRGARAASPGPTGPATPGAPAPGAPGAVPNGATTSNFDPALDLTHWSLWWDLNKAPYLDLKRHVRDAGLVTGEDGRLLDPPRPVTTLAPTEEQVRGQIVPALLAVLDEETNNDLVSSALIALAKIGAGDSPAEAARLEKSIERYLRDANQEIRETAAVSLGILACPRSIPLLAHLLWDTAEGRARVDRGEVDVRTRAFAAYGLGLIGARTEDVGERALVVRALRRALDLDRTATRDVSVACVLALSLVPLAAELEPPAEDDRAAEAGEGGGAPAALLALLADRERPTLLRAQCPIALARMLGAAPNVTDAAREWIGGALLDTLRRKHELPELRQSCILALGRIGTNDGTRELDLQIRAALRTAFADASEDQSRAFALIALAESAGRDGADAARRGLAESSAFLLEQLGGRRKSLRSWAGLACGVLGHALVRSGSGAQTLERMRVAVRETLEYERDPSDLGAYAIAAGLLGDAESVPRLRECLGQSLQDDARGWVAVGLGLLRDRESSASLQALLAASTYRPLLLRETAIAMELLGDKSAAATLVRMLAEATGLSAQSSIAIALGYVTDRRSVEPLLAALHARDRSERARSFAAVALGEVADKEMLPWNTKLALGTNYRAATATLSDPATGCGILDLF